MRAAFSIVVPSGTSIVLPSIVTLGILHLLLFYVQCRTERSRSAGVSLPLSLQGRAVATRFPLPGRQAHHYSGRAQTGRSIPHAKKIKRTSALLLSPLCPANRPALPNY